jgi:HSP20 family molecular chaperone IbpA
MARSNGRGRRGPDAWRAFDRIRSEIRSLRRLDDPGRLGSGWEDPSRVGIHEDEAGFVLVARVLAVPGEEIELSVERDEVVLSVPPIGDPWLDRVRHQRVPLPAAVDPDGAEVVYADGILVLRLPRRALRTNAATWN